MTVSEKLKPFLAQVNQAIAQAQADNLRFTPQMVRDNLDKLGAYVSSIPDINSISDAVIENDRLSVPVRVYRPSDSTALPVLLYFHGGGHMCGSIALYDPMCRKIALAARCIVIAVEYRLAPEHPYPAGLADAQLVLENYPQALDGIDSDAALIIAGDSAGGAICTTLAMNNQNNPAVNIDKQILIYPSVDYTLAFPSVQTNGQGYLLESQKVAWYFDHYFSSNEDRKAASPLYGPITDGLPATLVITAGCDPLRDEGLAYAAALKQQGIPVQQIQFDDMIHAFMNIEDLVQDECTRLFRLIGDYVAS